MRNIISHCEAKQPQTAVKQLSEIITHSLIGWFMAAREGGGYKFKQFVTQLNYSRYIMLQCVTQFQIHIVKPNNHKQLRDSFPTTKKVGSVSKAYSNHKHESQSVQDSTNDYLRMGVQIVCKSCSTAPHLLPTTKIAICAGETARHAARHLVRLEGGRRGPQSLEDLSRRPHAATLAVRLL